MSEVRRAKVDLRPGGSRKMDARRKRSTLQRIARLAMLDRGLLPDFSVEALAELDRIPDPPAGGASPTRDRRDLPWASIDNDDSRDLDQLTVAETLPGGAVKILVAVADVDALVKKGSAIDEHARHNTTSVYTAAEIFPMLPEKLSTDLTSLGFQEDRPAIVIELLVDGNGLLQGSEIYEATVRNRAKLAYNGVAAWLEGKGPLPGPAAAVEGLDANLRMQDLVAQRLRSFRYEQGALDLETIEARPVFDGEEIRDLQAERKNRAKEIIEDFMIAANGVTARYLMARKLPSLRRVVRSPKRWERIVEVASPFGVRLPPAPDPKALAEFLAVRKAADPLLFPDLSLTIIKLMGAGEYVVEIPGEAAPGHFGLAVRDYTHSTAPNRRYPDLITQRQLKAAMSGSTSPYGMEELAELARHCTAKEDDANKVERQVGKSAAAILLEPRIGERFEAIVTGDSEKGTWVRLPSPPVEGRLTQGYEGVDVGHRIRVQLVRTDVDRGYIDFKRVK
jgi:VacB/RNase II family 3'-5' exoribonuclease